MPAPSMPRSVGRLVTAALAATALSGGLLGAPMLAYGAPTSTPTPAPTTTAPAPSTGSTPTEPATKAPTSSATPTPRVDDSEDSPTSAGKSGSDKKVESDDRGATNETASAADRAETDEAETDEAETSKTEAEKTEDDADPTPGPVSAAGGAGDSVAEKQPLASSQAGADQVQAQAEAPAPGISLTKTATPTRVSKVGQVITYRFVATNSGAIALANVEISDGLEGLSRITCGQSESLPLQPGAALTCTATLTVTQDWLDFGDIDNSATVFGYIVGDGSDEADYVSANATARVSVDQKPSVALDASVSPTATADAGDRLRYSATATNTGNVTLTAARITSSLDALDLDCDPSARATLAPGKSIDCSGSYQVTGSDARRGRVSALLTARAEGPYGDPSSSGDDVTDDTRLRVAVTKPAAPGSDTGLADTGGPALPIGALGLAALLLGGALVRRGRRL